MNAQSPEITFLRKGIRRGLGAMFCRDLAGKVLVFYYPHPAARLFHTFFCAKLRILALDEHGSALSDDVVPPNRFKRLPPTRIVVECNPNLPLTQADLVAISAAIPGQPVPPHKGYRPWTG